MNATIAPEGERCFNLVVLQWVAVPIYLAMNATIAPEGVDLCKLNRMEKRKR